MKKSSLIGLMRVELNHIRFKVYCKCGKEFIAEDFEPECPYCDRIYQINMVNDKKELKISIFD
ncbi:MAG: hypothetical protein H3Z52_10330 [archaeon]|nr:hypothetical protein [archaeon]MCP8321317.1 hypothetical protein [archaeon]